MFNKNSEIKPRFSIRKLSVGAVSVLIGLTIFGFSGKPVAAEQTNSVSKKSEETITNDKQNNTENDSDKMQTLNLETSKSQTSLKTAALKESKVASDTTASEKALVPDKYNTSSSTPKVNGKDGNSSITNVTSDGSITYDYSINVKNKTTGEEESVHSGATGKDNKATLNADNVSEISAHLILANTSDQDKVIGNTDYDDNPDHYNPARHNDDEIKDDYVHPMVRNDDGSYSEVAEEADLIKLLPKAGEVVKITDSGNIFDTTNTTLYEGGH